MAVVADRANAAPRKTARRKPAKRARRGGPPRRSVGDFERIIAGLEERINQLTSAQNIRQSVTGATNQMGDAVSAVINRASTQVGEYVADKVSGVAGRVRDSATSVTGVAKAGTGAMQRIGGELERRPLMTVAIALGIGFLAGLAGRRDNAA